MSQGHMRNSNKNRIVCKRNVCLIMALKVLFEFSDRKITDLIISRIIESKDKDENLERCSFTIMWEILHMVWRT